MERNLLNVHGRKVAHRDLKPENILLKSDRPSITIVIADFGLAKDAKGTNLRTNCGTNIYKAPEIFIPQDYQFSVDL